MKEPFDEIRAKVEHIQNHVHWWTCPYGHVLHPEDQAKALECIRADAQEIVEACTRMLVTSQKEIP